MEKFLKENLKIRREGYGILIRPDGTKYIGNYKNDYQEGRGININKEGKELIGLFKDGHVIKGKSIMYYNEPNIHSMLFTTNYEGDFQNNKREGYGIFIMEDGSKYEGEFQKDAYCGKGTYYFSNGNKYEGRFKDNQKEGKGTITLANGFVFSFYSLKYMTFLYNKRLLLYGKMIYQYFWMIINFHFFN